MYALKMVSCENHEIRVWYPVGKLCPACYPDHYADVGDPAGGEAISQEAYLITEDPGPLLEAARQTLGLLDDVTRARVMDIVQVRGELERVLHGHG